MKDGMVVECMRVGKGIDMGERLIGMDLKHVGIGIG
ncbi:DUF436 family protein, partial [Staphylococcus pettenkoferi]